VLAVAAWPGPELGPGQASELYQAVGVGYGLNPAYRQHAFTPGDRVLLCSDGLTDPLCDADLEAVLRSELPLADVCDQLIERAENVGRSDDTTVVVIEPGG
jgi:protein phosphatase